MTQKNHIQQREDEKAFLEYIEQMPKSLGQRFASILIKDYGYDAFEDFWMRLRSARIEEEPYLDLDEDERTALAKAIATCSRRQFIRTATGFGLCAAGALLGRSAVNDLNEDSSFTRRYGGQPDPIITALKIGGALVATGVGFERLIHDGSTPSEYRVATVAMGIKGQENVNELVRTLDQLFDPIEISLTETGVRSRL